MISLTEGPLSPSVQGLLSPSVHLIAIVQTSIIGNTDRPRHGHEKMGDRAFSVEGL